MLPEAAERIMAAYVNALQGQGLRISKIILYGSQARGTAGAGSDIDLLVVSPDFAGMRPWRQWEALGKATAAVRQPIEALACTPQEVEGQKGNRASFQGYVLSQPEIVEYIVEPPAALD